MQLRKQPVEDGDGHWHIKKKSSTCTSEAASQSKTQLTGMGDTFYSNVWSLRKARRKYWLDLLDEGGRLSIHGRRNSILCMAVTKKCPSDNIGAKGGSVKSKALGDGAFGEVDGSNPRGSPHLSAPS
ncbi:hypothetical protein PG997_002304 [Apiospora hydei]|uniref:Uncharacterized protein n=1 Tax=Apiospora hydei TaxID=1337664 RepID=A0ABR1X957_9PEZI